MRTLLESRVPAGPPRYRHPDWLERFDWLVQGTTGRGDGDDPFDLGIFGPGDPDRIGSRWQDLIRGLEMEDSVLSRQIHGTRIQRHGLSDDSPPSPDGREPDLRSRSSEGPILVEGIDGHVTDQPALLLTVTVADCVPVTLVDSRGRAVALAHGGWRGIAGGIVEGAVDALEREYEVAPGDLHLHAGPAICGDCYEVGPEVHEALDLDVPPKPAPVDLRAAVAARAVARGIPEENVTVSGHCSLCGPGMFFSHRRGDVERQVGFVAIRRT